MFIAGAVACNDRGGTFPEPPTADGGDTTPTADAMTTDAGGASDAEAGDATGFTFNRGTSRDIARALVLLADMKMLVAGSNDDSGSGRPLVMRVLPDGSLDATFGIAGKVLLPLGATGRVEVARVSADGTIVLGILSTPVDTEPNGYLVRLRPDGSRDTTFGDDGVVGVPGLVDAVVDSAGRLVVATREGLARYRADGSTDPSFANVSGAYLHLALDASGRVLATDGTTITRFDAAGATDPTFANGVPLAIPGAAGLLAPRPDGSVVVGASLIVHVRADGTVDPGFASGGQTEILGELRALRTGTDGSIVAVLYDRVCAFDATGRSIATFVGLRDATAAELPAAGAVVVSERSTAPGGDLALHHYAWDRPGGKHVVSRVRSGASIERGSDILRSADGRLAVVGTASRADAEQLGKSVVRIAHLDASGTPEGKLLELVEQPKDLGLASDDRIVSATDDWRFFRYLADGQRDPAFGVDGALAVTTARSRLAGFRIGADDRIWAVGYSGTGVSPPLSPTTAIARILPDGALDPAFGRDGIAPNRGASVDEPLALQPDGKLVLGLRFAIYRDMQGSVNVTRFTAEGTPEPGYVRAVLGLPEAEPEYVVLQHALTGRDGSLTITGTLRRERFVRRIRPDGGVDDTFAFTAAGRESTPAAALLPDGQLVLAGSRIVDHRKQLYVARYGTTGAFAAETVIPRGPGNHELTAIEVLADGTLVATGTTWSPETDADQLIVRLAVP